MLVKTNLVPSRSEGRRLIMQGGISVDGKKIEKAVECLKLSDFDKGYVIIKKGKKIYHKALL